MQTGSMRVMAVAAARPNFMEVAPLLRELRAREHADPKLDPFAGDRESPDE